MTSRARGSFGARLYALLLYLYPSRFRREYGEAMQQLFNDQRRAVRGAGGYAMLWLKTLRDLVLSVPAAHSNATSSKGAVVLWIVVAVLAVVFVVNGVVLPSYLSRVPSDAAAAVAATSADGPTGEFRTVAQVAAGLVSTLLAFGAFLFAVRQRRVANGMAAFVVGAALTFMALAMNPWLWLPLDRYPAGIMWALGVWPLAAVAYVAATIASRRQVGGVG